MSRNGRRNGAWAISLTLGLLVAGAAPLWSQATGTIEGRITAEVTEQPIAYARIYLVASPRVAATTGEDGRYTLREVPAGTQLVRVSVLGFSRVEASLAVGPGQTVTFNSTLRRAVISLDEVVVTGTAGAQERRTIGNAVGAISVAEIEAAPVASAVEALTARVPGLTLMANSGQAGASSNIRIRGAGSLAGGYAPVFYVDGVRIESGLVEAASTYQGGTALDFLNPDDIESIEVIKGPAAATLYGAEAANGVIQVITKKGRRGAQATRWSTSLEMGQNEWTKELGSYKTYWRCTAAQQTTGTANPGCRVAAGNWPADSVTWWGKDANGDAVLNTGIPAEDITDLGDGTLLLQDDPLFRHPAALRTGTVTDFNASVRGGSENMGYFLSFNRLNEDGVFFNNFNRRMGGRGNFDAQLSPTIDVSTQFSYTRTHLQQPLSNNASNSVSRNAMRGKARGPRGPWEAGFLGFSPWVSNDFDNQNRVERMTIGLTTNWVPADWFRHRLTMGLDRQSYRETQFERQDTTGRAPWGSVAATGTIAHELQTIHRWTADYTGSVDFDMSESVNSVFSGGMQLNARTRRGYTAEGEGLVANSLNLVGLAASTNADEELVEQTSLGFFFEERLGWRDRMFLTGAVRIDDNSAFGSDFSLVVYPKASLSWLVSDESFFNLGVVDDLKLRFAWGEAGNAPAPFSADRTYTGGQGVAGDALVSTLLISSYGNPNLKAETGREWEAGFDASLLNQRAGLEFTYYNKKTVDALVEIPDPRSTGFGGNHLINIGALSNSGIELLLTATPVYSATFDWEAALSFSTNSNKLVSFNGSREEIIFGAFADVQRHREGYPLGGFWAVDVERDAAGEPVLRDGAGTIVTDPAVGNPTVLADCRWAPSDPTWDQAAECDDIYMGPSRPTRELALTNTFTLLQNLRISALFDYRGGHYQWCAICSINSRIDLNTWDINTGGTSLNPDVTAADVEVLRSLQTKSHITKADNIKFRELSLTYNFPERWTRVIPGSRWSFTLAGRNLKIWTKYKGRGDPEVQFDPGSAFQMLDYASTPQTRRLSASMRVTF
jgi:TonB-linked SusC/RagA family outer membrane protein